MILKHILAVKTHALGDVLMVTPAIRALKRRYPEATIDFLTGSWSVGAIRTNPHINRVIEVPDSVFHNPEYRGLYTLSKQIRRQRYDLAVVFQPSRFIHLFLRFSGIDTLAAPVKTQSSYLVRFPAPWRPDRSRYVVCDFLDVAAAAGASADDSQLEFEIPAEASGIINARLHREQFEKREYVVICPAGGHNPRDFVAQKVWPQENYCELIDRLKKHQIKIIIAGSRDDRPMIPKVLAIPGIIDWVGKTSFTELALLLQKARFLITNDSAPMHLALAIRCPFVAIFGPSNRDTLLPREGKFLVAAADIPCAPCYSNEPFKMCERFDCICSVTVEAVFEKVMEAWQIF